MDNQGAKFERPSTLGAFPQLYPYVMEHINETPVQRRLRVSAATAERSQMMGAPDEAQFFQWLLQLIGAKRVIEVGVFRGSTTLAMALGLPEDGKVVGFDISEEYARMGKEAWKEANVENKIDFRVGPAKEGLEHLLAAGEAGTYDFAFIDADKENYPEYYELALQLVRRGGVIAVDNVLWGGLVLDPVEAQESHTRAITLLNERIKSDSRVAAVMLPVADGCYLARKR
jgi:predicted O-methyltransferase YrrM